MNPQMDQAKAEAWLKIMDDPRFKKMLDNARETLERIAAEILQRHDAAPSESSKEK